MFQSILRHRPTRPSFLFRCYSQGAFDISQLLAKTGALDTSKSRGNRFSARYDQTKGKPDFKNNPRDYKGHRSDSGQRRQEPQRKNHRENDKFRFEINTGSQRAQEAIKDIVIKVKESSPTFQVQFVNPTTKKIQVQHLSKIVNNLDLASQGLLHVPAQEEGKLPLVRLIKSMEMIQNYSDMLAAQKEAELMASGSERFKKKMLIRQQAEKKKSATKVLTLSWSISLSDLVNQKKTEIVSRLKKDEKFQILVGDKRGGIDEDSEEDFVSKLNKLNDEDYEFEMNKRELLFEKLQQLLEECECKTEISGSLKTRMMVKVTAKSPAPSKVEETSQLTEKELKKIRKAQRAREPVKKASTSDQDLDALYSFKIED